MSAKIKVTLVKSVNGTIQSQRATVRALGLHKVGSSHILPKRPEVEGMISAVRHLVHTEEVQG